MSNNQSPRLNRVIAVIGKTKWNISSQAADDYYKQIFENLLGTKVVVNTISHINRNDMIMAGASLIAENGDFAKKTDKNKIDAILLKVVTPYMNPSLITEELPPIQ